MESNEELTREKVNLILQKKLTGLDLLFIDGVNVSSSLRDTLVIDKVAHSEEAILEIYAAAPQQTPHPGDGRQVFLKSFFQSGALRPVPGGPAEDQPPPRVWTSPWIPGSCARRTSSWR